MLFCDNSCLCVILNKVICDFPATAFCIMSSRYLVVDEQFKPVLWVLELQQAFKKHCDKGRELLNEDANHHQWVFTLLWRRTSIMWVPEERIYHCSLVSNSR